MVYIGPGEFTMGTASGDPDEAPPHTVQLAGFLMDKFEVTHAMYTQAELPNPSHWQDDPRKPVEQVRWSGVRRYCNERSLMEGLEPCYDEASSGWPRIPGANGYRLPTEAEWEKAARGGLAGNTYPWGHTATSDNLNYGRTPGEALLGGQYAPNGYGLYDMAGNVAEWAWDWHGSYSADDQTDPTGPASGTERIYRGGSWELSISRARCADRAESKPWTSEPMIGFRLVISGD